MQHDDSRDADSPRPAFAAVPERSSGDHLLRIVQNHHVQLSAMADTKANIIITVSSIVLTLVMGRLQDPVLRPGLLVLGAFTLVALLLAILAVVPKFRGVKKHEGPLPPWFNVLFFGHFTSLDRDRFVRELADAMAPGRAYETVAKDVYGIGLYLARHKYPYLRLSYLFFLSGFLLSCVVQAVQLLRH
ncbi:Pycsar system effector family protein [Chiayiivirga flava]|uniref:Pycsar effector protein domain-containing protein n=1 Tax=Chiayiivirga flava TaxID=659595 RepID=A0A7W8D9F6_9GAMM|nr:Pycsar system effector family protein [Chiayiivirga flava]MBB5209011.1 hypothetical protein [Chiayiivirga flava]